LIGANTNRFSPSAYAIQRTVISLASILVHCRLSCSGVAEQSVFVRFAVQVVYSIVVQLIVDSTTTHLDAHISLAILEVAPSDLGLNLSVESDTRALILVLSGELAVTYVHQLDFVEGAIDVERSVFLEVDAQYVDQSGVAGDHNSSSAVLDRSPF
jgi:hypothetical protein